MWRRTHPDLLGGPSSVGFWNFPELEPLELPDLHQLLVWGVRVVANETDEIPFRDLVSERNSQRPGLRLQLVEGEVRDGFHHRRGVVLHPVLLYRCFDLFHGPAVVDYHSAPACFLEQLHFVHLADGRRSPCGAAHDLQRLEEEEGNLNAMWPSQKLFCRTKTAEKTVVHIRAQRHQLRSQEAFRSCCRNPP